MASQDQTDRLSQISTIWEDLFRAQNVQADPGRQVLGKLLQRYHRAAFRYLLTATGREDGAADMLQEFAVKFLEGKFQHADPAKGRFRDYLKTALINLVRKDANRAARTVVQSNSAFELHLPPEEPTAADSDELFLTGWRKTLMDQVWNDLAAVETRTGTPYHTVMKMHTAHPDESSAALAKRLTAWLRPREPYTDAAVRKMLQRGRKMMAEFLVREVARSIPTRDLDVVEQELIDLGYHAHCRPALDEMRANGTAITLE